MKHTELINFLINQRNAKRYLEVGVHNEQNTFLNVDCTFKVTTFPNSSDNFFNYNRDKFDIVFIDGVHTEEQTIKDIENACHCLSKNGIIIVHDCMPPDEWHQREPHEFHEGENWNGTVWKAALRVSNKTIYKCTLLDTDWGCGIIDMSQIQVPKCRQLPENINYKMHYSCLLEYKQAVPDYLREHVKVFYHLACMGNWQEVFKEQMALLSRNGFGHINLTVLGTEDDLEILYLIDEELKVNPCITFWSPDLTHFETPALLGMEEYARQIDGYVLYIHSKGVSNPADKTKIKWRRLMMQELVENWECCMMQLPYYDLIGVNWRDMPPTSHFSGNFWYASTGYLRKLAPFKQYYDNPRYPIWDAVYNKRLGCEFWISSGQQPPKVLSLFCRNEDFCNDGFWVNK